MQSYAPLELGATQKAVLRAYANECHPKIKPEEKDVYKFVVNTGLIDGSQDHITDRGLAYAITQCGVSFSWFIKRHKWQNRLASRIMLVENMTKGHPEHRDVVQLERYKLLLKYNRFQKTNAEGDGIDNCVEMAFMVTEWINNILQNHPQVPWRGIRNGLADYDFQGELDTIPDTKEAFTEYVQKCMARFSK